MKKHLILIFTIILFCFITTNIFSQTDSIPAAPPEKPIKNKPPFKDRLIFGGNFGLQFGSVTYIDLSPTIGYKVTEKFHAGLGPTYIYYSEKYRFSNGSTETFSTNIYGGKVYARYFVLENLFLHHETELLNIEVFDPFFYGRSERKNIISPLVGAGYIQRFGRSGGLFLMALFNLNETPDSPYTNPVIRIGFNFGL